MVLKLLDIEKELIFQVLEKNLFGCLRPLLHDLYHKLYDDLIKAKRTVNVSKKIITGLEVDIDIL